MATMFFHSHGLMIEKKLQRSTNLILILWKKKSEILKSHFDTLQKKNFKNFVVFFFQIIY